ncbi:aldo/keto reductase [Foetidibacter luteolus]|uniref:aldo/keto reductase n=1 Tax=Foetidibacter luteolus TaxID=2608880 RepID=UPI00129BBB5C|nr:aldo/keto reductase [Foetidibacter luteolus]
MKYNNLGKTNIRVSEIGYGCMALKNDAATNEQLLLTALDNGINYFDTADIYQDGENEVIIGRAFKQRRKDVIIATKAGNVRRPDGGLSWNATKEHILSAVEKSLQRLQTDYIDLYQLHGGTLDDNIDETIEAFELLLQQGKIRSYGISSIRPNVIREYVKRSNIASVMMQYSLLDRRPEETCFQLLHDNHISVLARGSVAQGLLLDKPAAPYLDYSAEQVTQAAQAIKAASSNQRAATPTTLQFVLQHPAVTSAVVGMRNMQQMEAALQTTISPALTVEETALLKSSIPVNYYTAHR